MPATLPVIRAAASACRTGLLILAITLPSPAAADVAIRFSSSQSSQVVVDGLSAETLAALADAQLDRSGWQRVFALYVLADGKRSNLPVLGDYAVRGDRLVFTPQFPFKPGLEYHAVFDSAAFPIARLREARVEATLRVPGHPRGQPTVVTAIYPSSDAVPENLLKFYVHFSAPMSRGNVYRHIQLLDAKGAPVELPFLELAEELWDDSGRRLTLLLDPGRVKQDLKPHIEVGRALTQGRAYTLLIANTWRDANGATLAREFRKSFQVGRADTRQPDPHQWRLELPAAGTRQPLIVRFHEPMDHALAQHCVRVSSPTKSNLDGRVTVTMQETQWSFEPEKPWALGDHQLLIDATLEDLAGNSIGRLFEVYLPSGRPADVDQFRLPFTIGSEPTQSAAPRLDSSVR